MPIDPDAPAGPQVDLSELAEGGLVFLVPTGQLAAPFGDGRLERTTVGRPSPADRVGHLFGHRLGVDLPDVLAVALSSPTQSVMDVLTGEGLGDIDLAAVSVFAVPLWAIPADQRATVAGLCEHPQLNPTKCPTSVPSGAAFLVVAKPYIRHVWLHSDLKNLEGFL